MTTKEQEQVTGGPLPPSFEAAAAAIASRCYADRDFARRMRENPKAAIEEVCGKKLPESLAIKVHENDGKTWHVPISQGGDTDKLSDEQLRDVSGGFEVIFMIIAVAAATTVTASVLTGAGAGIAVAAGQA